MLPHIPTSGAGAIAAAVTALAALAAPAGAQITTTIDAQDYDVWMYPPGAAGFSPYAPSFGAPVGTDDLDRLGYFFPVFDVADVPIAPGEEILALTLRIRLLNSSSFDPNQGYIYDDTYDPVSSYGDGAVDDDPGRPVELYAPLLQSGLTLADWSEASTPVIGPDGYNALPGDFATGAIRNVQNNVDEGFDVEPLAIGLTDDLVQDGELLRVADGATVAFDIDLTSNDAARAHFTAEAAAGYLGFIVSSLHDAGEFGAGGDDVFPRWATLESFGSFDASLDVTVGEVKPPPPACEGDLDDDLQVGSADLNILLAAFGQDDAGDLNDDGVTNSADLNILLAAFGDVCTP